VRGTMSDSLKTNLSRMTNAAMAREKQ
jgi:hypothetical protein